MNSRKLNRGITRWRIWKVTLLLEITRRSNTRRLVATLWKYKDRTLTDIGWFLLAEKGKTRGYYSKNAMRLKRRLGRRGIVGVRCFGWSQMSQTCRNFNAASFCWYLELLDHIACALQIIVRTDEKEDLFLIIPVKSRYSSVRTSRAYDDYYYRSRAYDDYDDYQDDQAMMIIKSCH